MVAKNHNFLRLWALDASYSYQLDGNLGAIMPNPFLRIGPQLASDRLPKFDIGKLNQSYFDRLRARVVEAGSKGIYVSVMLTNGIFVENANTSLYSMYRNPENNVNGDLSSLTNLTQYTLSNTAWVRYMDAYVDKVVDTVNDLNTSSMKSPMKRDRTRPIGRSTSLTGFTRAKLANKSSILSVRPLIAPVPAIPP